MACSRREFLKSGAALGALSMTSGGLAARTGGSVGPRVVASGNGLRATERAMTILRDDGGGPLDAVVAGVNIVEEDPEDMSVGYGGIPNEEGVVELDSSVMYGPTHQAGAVASLRNIKTPSRVARLVMERTDHVLLVGDGALRFARAHGFEEVDLLTPKAREVWLGWKESMSDRDNWFPPAGEGIAAEIRAAMAHHGTINCLAIDERGRLAGVTTTSGLGFKIPGRVGDSPIIGAGLYVDNEIGAAGSTGRGEANLQTCASYGVVEIMGRGASPEEACLRQLERIAAKTRLVPRLTDADGRPRFGLNFYALNRNGEFGAAAFFSGSRYAVHDGLENRLRECAYLWRQER